MSVLESLQKILNLAGSVYIDFNGKEGYVIEAGGLYFRDDPGSLKEIIEDMASYLEEEEAFEDEGRAEGATPDIY